MDLLPEERELLIAAEQNARRAMADARDVAERILKEAYSEATKLLIQQQEAAALLLLQQTEEFDRAHAEAAVEAAALSDSQVSDQRTHRLWDAEQLLLAQQRAADILLKAQRDAAEKLTEGVERAATDEMMAGQRKAAAFLLEVRMRIEADRAAKTRVR